MSLYPPIHSSYSQTSCNPVMTGRFCFYKWRQWDQTINSGQNKPPQTHSQSNLEVVNSDLWEVSSINPYILVSRSAWKDEKVEQNCSQEGEAKHNPPINFCYLGWGDGSRPWRAFQAPLTQVSFPFPPVYSWGISRQNWIQNPSARFWVHCGISSGLNVSRRPPTGRASLSGVLDWFGRARAELLLRSYGLVDTTPTL